MAGLRAIEKLLRYPTARERFQTICIGLENKDDCDKLDRWSFSLASLRWEAIYDFCHHLLPLQCILRKYWDRKKYVTGMTGTKFQRLQVSASASTDHYSASPDALEASIKSDSFWSAVSIVENISYESEFCGRWAEGCHCHGDLEWRWRLLQTDQHQRRKKRRIQFRCPLKGCRAMELASADALYRLKALMNRNKGALTCES